MRAPLNKIIEPYGFGLGYREELQEEIICNKDKIDCIEIISEHIIFGDISVEKVLELSSTFKIILHCIGLSIGSTCVEEKTIHRYREICDIINPILFGDHLALTQVNGIDFGHLTPLLYSKDQLEICVDNVNKIQDILSRQILIENIPHHFLLSDSILVETDFISKLVQKTDCGLIFDINNLYVNSVNLKFDFRQYIKNYPLERVKQIHIAGYSIVDDVLYDSHCNDVSEEVWSILDYLSKITTIKGGIIERDKNFGSFENLLKEVTKAKSIISNNSKEVL